MAEGRALVARSTGDEAETKRALALDLEDLTTPPSEYLVECEQPPTTFPVPFVVATPTPEPPSPSEADRTIFVYSGEMIEYKVPVSGSYRVRACGAKAADGESKIGGRGGNR